MSGAPSLLLLALAAPGELLESLIIAEAVGELRVRRVVRAIVSLRRSVSGRVAVR